MATEKRKIHRVVDANGSLVQVLPETSAEQVTLADVGGKFTSSNVEGALQELATGIPGAGKVDDVVNADGTSIVDSNKKAQLKNAVVKEAGKTTQAVRFVGTLAAGGATSVSFDGSKDTAVTMDGADFVMGGTSSASTQTATYSLKEQSGLTAGTYQGITVDKKGRVTAAQDMQYATKQELQEAEAGKKNTFTYDDYQKFVAATDALAKTAMGVGDNVLIKTLNVPDMWVTRVNAVSTQYKYVDDQSIVNALNTTNGLTVGYFTFSQLETTKVDLTSYQTKTDNSLNTTSKTVVGAINEVKGVADGAATKAASNASVISDIQDGKVAVGEAKKVQNKLQIRTKSTGSPIDAGAYDGSAVRNVDFDGSFILESIGDTTTIGLVSAPKVAKALKLTGSSSQGTQQSVEYDGSKAFQLAFYEGDFIFPPNPTTGFGMVTLGYTGVEKGQYSAVNVDTKGRVTAGGYSQEFGTSGQTTPSANLMVNGLFWELQ